ncbi:MAG: hypothetical protein ACRDYC_09320 [Acidimicrobiales bacterium]
MTTSTSNIGDDVAWGIGGLAIGLAVIGVVMLSFSRRRESATS